MSEVPENSKKPTSKSRLTPQQWADIAAHWEMGSSTAQALADQYGLAKETIYRKMKKMKIVRGEKASAHIAAVQEEMIEQAKDNAAISAERIAETNEFYYRTNKALGQLNSAEMVNLKNANDAAEVEKIIGKLKGFKLNAEIAKLTRQERYTVNGFKEGDLSGDDIEDLIIEDMTTDDLVEVRKTQAENMIGIPGASIEDSLVNEDDLDFIGSLEEVLKEGG